MFQSLEPLPPDAIIGIMAMFRQDKDPRKVDLSVGVYQDEDGNTPVLECVRQAERQVLSEQKTKSYVGIAGNASFNESVEKILFGADHPARKALFCADPGRQRWVECCWSHDHSCTTGCTGVVE